jgi:hypothetical protein
LSLFAGQMDLGGEPSPGLTQAVVVWLGAGPARRFLPSLAGAAGSCGALMGPADRGVDIGLPRDQSGRVRPGLQPGQKFGPGAVALPAAEEAVGLLYSPDSCGRSFRGAPVRICRRIPGSGRGWSPGRLVREARGLIEQLNHVIPGDAHVLPGRCARGKMRAR